MLFKLIGTVILGAVIFIFCFWQMQSSSLNLNTTQQMALAAIVTTIALSWLTIFYKSLSFVSLTYGIAALVLALWLGNIIILIFSAVSTLIALVYVRLYTDFDRFVLLETRANLWFKGLFEAMISLFIIAVSSKYMYLL
ncbi:MAG: hypothetical protein ABIJ81_01780 [Patescibacteria group bacterium]